MCGEVEATPTGGGADGQQQGLEGSSQSEMGSQKGNGPALARGPVSEYLNRQEPNPPQTLAADGAVVQPEKERDPPIDPHTHTPGDVLQATPLQLRVWQQADPTLQKVRELAASQNRMRVQEGQYSSTVVDWSTGDGHPHREGTTMCWPMINWSWHSSATNWSSALPTIYQWPVISASTRQRGES